jgi:hypothetical protein
MAVSPARAAAVSVPAAATAAVSVPAVSVPAAATAVPAVRVTLRSVVTDVLGWVGWTSLAPYVPLPNLPVPAPLDSLWLGVRDIVRRLGHPVGVAGSVDLAGVPSDTVVSADGTRAVVVAVDDNWDAGVHTTQVAVMDTATGGQIGTTLVLDGAALNPPVLTADGTRAVITVADYDSVYGTRVTVLDLATGTQVGTAVALYGGSSKPVLSADGSRALITTNDGSTSGGAWLSIIDTSTGALQGASLHFSSAPSVLSADGSRAVVATPHLDDATNTVTTGLAVFDTDTGDQVGATVSFTTTGNQWTTGTQMVRTDDTHALFIAYDANATQLAMFDTATGTQVGSTLTLAGRYAEHVLVADGARALVATSLTDPANGTTSTAVTMIDTATNTQLSAAPVLLPGTDFVTILARSGILVNGTGAQALITTVEGGGSTAMTHVSAIDTMTGAQIGATITLAGEPLRASGAWMAPVLSADGIHALITLVDGGDDLTHVVIVDTVSGTQTGVVASLPGRPDTSQPITADGSRVLIATTEGDDINGYSTRLSVVDTATGTLLGTPLTFQGQVGSLLLSTDGSRALITSAAAYTDAQLIVIDTATGKQVGATTTFRGGVDDARLLGTDGSRALYSTEAWNPFTYTAMSYAILIDPVTGQVLGTQAVPGEVWQPWVSTDGSRAVFTTQVYYFWGLRPPSTEMAVLQIT